MSAHEAKRRAFGGLGDLGLGVAVAGLFVVRLELWWVVVAAIGGAYVGVLALPQWRGVARSRARAIDAAYFFAPALGLPLAIAAVSAATGALGTFVGTIGVALPSSPASTFAAILAASLATVLVMDGARVDRDAARAPTMLIAAATWSAVIVRLISIAAIASVPSELFWSDGPFLVNALKLDAREPIYGAPELLDSYTYSPLIDLFHHAILSPFGLELSLRASRVIVVVEQLGAAATFAWTLWPHLSSRDRAWSLGVVTLACLASSIAPSVHPDHAVLFCVAIAFALVLAKDRWPPIAWWLALVLVTPIAISFKLSGGGIGLGLAVVAMIERRWRVVGALVGSGLLCVATIPMFDATLGRFHFYAFDVQRACPIVWMALAEIPRSAFGVAAIVVAMFAIVVARFDRAAVDRVVVRATLLGGGVALASIPGFIKYCGRDNNLTPILVVAIVALVVVASNHAVSTRAKLHPVLAAILALALVLHARPLEAPPSFGERDAGRADSDAIARALKDDAAAKRSTLLLIHAAAWIDAGRRDVPHDRMLSALELHLAGRREAAALVDHIDDGRYDTIVASGAQLADESGLRGEYDVRVRRALEARYEIVYPRGATSAASVRGAVIFRRRISSSTP